MVTIAVAYVAIGLILIALALPLMLGKVRPNIWYGFRIRLTLDDPAIWYPVNAWAGRRLLALGVAVLIVALVSLVLPGVLFPWCAVGLAAGLIVAVVAVLVFGVRYARRLARGEK